jgi:MoaA/NifB/PqqE/SkfB family radical SAM enzyme
MKDSHVATTFSDILESTWRENILFSALIELTFRCNLDCFFCYNDIGMRGVPLSTAEYFRLFEDLRELGTMNLTLSGGEPLAHPEFFTLGRKARELDFVVRVKSNGHALRGRLARRLREEVDPFLVEISLHGASPETHDRQTRVPGSFARLMSNLREMQALGLRIKLNCPVTKWNEHELEGMFTLADDFGVPLQPDPEISRRDDGDDAPLQIAPSREGIAHLLRIQEERALANRARRGKAAADYPTTAPPAASALAKHCGAGSSSVTVDPYGNVYPCVQWRRHVGNLHLESIKTLWSGSAQLADVRRLVVEVKQMVDALPTPGFGFCPGVAEKETGHSTHLYPVARLMLDLRKGTQRNRISGESGVSIPTPAATGQVAPIEE